MIRMLSIPAMGIRLSGHSLLVWLSIWMLIVPLVHVHPDADHRHGVSDHRHGGTVHTVFSKDLTCEFSVHDHTLVATHESHSPFHVVAHPRHGLEHLEIGLVLGSSTEPQSGKGTPLDVAAHFVQPIEHSIHELSRLAEVAPSPPIGLFLATAHPSRAPPPA